MIFFTLHGTVVIVVGTNHLGLQALPSKDAVAELRAFVTKFQQAAKAHLEGAPCEYGFLD